MHHHDLPSGNYKVYFDVPSAPPPDQTNVRVKVTRVESLMPEGGGDDLSLDLFIDGAKITKKLPDNTNVHVFSWAVQRKLNPGGVDIVFKLRDVSPGPAYGTSSGAKCGSWPDGDTYSPCPSAVRKIDLASIGGWEGDPNEGVLHLNLATKKITGSAAGDAGQPLTPTGQLPKGKLEVIVTVD